MSEACAFFMNETIFIIAKSLLLHNRFFSPRADTLNVMTILGALKIHLPLRFAATIHDLFH